MGLYHQFQAAITFLNFIPVIQIVSISLKRSHKGLVKKYLRRIILFKSNEYLKSYFIPFVLHIQQALSLMRILICNV